MIEKINSIKKEAKEKLNNNKLIFLISALSIVVPIAMFLIPKVSLLFFTFFFVGFRIVLAKTTLKCARGESIVKEDIYNIANGGNLVLLFGWQILYVFVSITPIIMTSLILNTYDKPIFLVLNLIALIPLSYLAILIYSNIALSKFITLDHKDISRRDAIYTNRAYIKGYRNEFACMLLTFVPWVLLGIITFGLAFTYVIPYINTSVAIWYDKLGRSDVFKTKKEKKRKRLLRN